MKEMQAEITFPENTDLKTKLHPRITFTNQRLQMNVTQAYSVDEILGSKRKFWLIDRSSNQTSISSEVHFWTLIKYI